MSSDVDSSRNKKTKERRKTKTSYTTFPQIRTFNAEIIENKEAKLIEDESCFVPLYFILYDAATHTQMMQLCIVVIEYSIQLLNEESASFFSVLFLPFLFFWFPFLPIDKEMNSAFYIT